MNTHPDGCIPAGTTIPQGTVLRSSLTAYLVRSEDGTDTWVPFTVVHPRRPVEPLVVFG